MFQNPRLLTKALSAAADNVMVLFMHTPWMKVFIRRMLTQGFTAEEAHEIISQNIWRLIEAYHDRLTPTSTAVALAEEYREPDESDLGGEVLVAPPQDGGEHFGTLLQQILGIHPN